MSNEGVIYSYFSFVRSSVFFFFLQASFRVQINVRMDWNYNDVYEDENWSVVSIQFWIP